MRAPLAVSRLFAAALVLVFCACKPDLPQTPTEKVVTAVFDPTAAKIPLPNDLVFLANLNSVCPNTAAGPPSCAQAELLASFGGKFPNDQEVAITIDFSEIDFHTNGVQSPAAPELDFTSFKSTTFFVASLSATGATEVPIDPPKASDYVRTSDHGTLTIHHKDHTPWPPGNFAVVMRGGDDGVKTTDGTPVSASQIFALIAQGQDLTDPKNLGLLRAQTGSLELAIQQGAQLNALVNLYKQSAFIAADTRFPHQELAIATTFAISSTTNVTVDAARGIVPLPIDLLRDPVGGHLTPLAACTLAGSKLAADGTCPNPAAGGFQALDGFSTTGALLAQTSDLVIASTVRAPGAVLLFDLTTPAQPVQVSPADFIAEPCEVTFNPATNPVSSGCTTTGGTVAGALAPAIVIQPAGATAGEPGGGVFRTRPLKDHTDYAVVITNTVHDKADKAIGPGTVAKILGLTHPIVVGGKSQLQGVDDATGAALEKMRLQLQPVIAALPAADRPKVAMAYTFRTQTILSQAVQLAALPYSPAVQPQAPVPVGTLSIESATDAFHKWGVDTAIVPSSNIDQILEVDIETFNALDPITGAFMADPTKAPKERIHVLIATPNPANVPTNQCLGPTGPNCAPMMVFRHGLGSGRGAMLTVADTFAAAGMVTVAIDAAKHGDRSFCTSAPAGPTTGCNGGAACVTLLPPGAQGDAHPPGTCGAAGFVKRPVSPTCAANPSPCFQPITDGIPLVSSNYLTTTNFFRTRDTLRQDLIDQSQLIRALAFVPTNPPTAHAVFDQMVTRGVVINPGTIYFSGQSLGSIQGVLDVATNPRISKAAFNVGGGTVVDIFSNSPAFTAATDALLMQLGIARGTPQFLQFLVVAKTVLDPADPINFAGHLTDHTLPNLLANPNGSVAQAPKKVLSQIANCDGVVPNPFNLIDASNIYAGNTPAVPLPAVPAFFTPGLTGAFQLFVGTDFNPAPGGTPFGTCNVPTAFVTHAFLTDWGSATSSSLAAKAQTDIAKFVTADILPLTVQRP
jgi:hypothetical protein